MANKKFKIGIFGGERGRFVLNEEKNLSDQMEVVALCEKNQTTIDNLWEEKILHEGVTVYSDFDEMLDSGIDAVVLANYFHEHAKYAIKAMKKGVAVLSETTAAPSLGECVQLVEAYEETNTKYMLGANCVFWRVVQAMRRVMDEGKFGRAVFGDAEYLHPSVPNSAPNPRIPASGKPLDLENLHWRNTLPCCYYNMHDLGPMMYITNSFPKSVSGRAVFNDFARKKTVGHAKAFALVEMDNGSMINYSGCTSAGSLSKWYRLACETGTIESVRYDQSEYKLIECGAHEDPTITEHTWTSSGTLNAEEEAILNKSMSADSEHGGVPHGGVDFALLVHFLKFLRDEEQPFFDVYHAVSLSATGILAWYSMITDNRKFNIPDFRVKEERDKIRDDFRMPFAQRYDDLTLPCRYEEGFEI